VNPVPHGGSGGPRPIVVELPLSGYRVDREPDHCGLGRVVDDAIRCSFGGDRIVARGISIDDHPGHTVDDLVATILATGTDRYDPCRVGDRYDNVDGKQIDLFGFRRTVTARMRLFEHLCWGFYHGAIAVHGRPVRLDIITIYDALLLRAVLHRYAGRTDRKRDGFRFVAPENKPAAVLGVMVLGR